MNIHDRETPVNPPAVDFDANDERRWQAQERARRSVSRGVADAEADALELRIARALLHAAPVDLPFDFAARVAALARAQAAANTLLEQRLLRGLVLVFALSTAVVVAWYGRGWMAELAALLPGGNDALGWTGAAAICLLVNWGWDALRTQLQQGPDVHA